jgi:hypothetical protein
MLSFTSYDLIDACKEPGCPVCRLEQRYVKGYLDNLFYESVNDIELRKTLRLSMGFCPEHGWMAANQKFPQRLGLAIIYKDVLNATIRQLTKEVRSPSRGWKKFLGFIPYQSNLLMDKAALALTPKARCPVCQQQQRFHTSIISSIIAKSSLREMLTAIEASDGLCIPHLRWVLQEIKDPASCSALINTHLDKWETVKEDLAEIIRKSDYRFVDEGPGKEAHAWLQALEIATGRQRDLKKKP